MDGRWIEWDPVHIENEHNKYVYCSNRIVGRNDYLGLWSRIDEWSFSDDKYNGTICAESDDQVQDLSRIFKVPVKINGALIAGNKYSVGSILKALENKIRSNIADATRYLRGSFGTPAYIDPHWGIDEINRLYSGKRGPIECCYAAQLVMTKGIERSIGESNFAKLYIFGDFNKPSGKAIMKSPVHNVHMMKLGDWGYIQNDPQYKRRSYSGSMQGENVIKVSNGLLWGFPFGSNNPEFFIEQLKLASEELGITNPQVGFIPEYNFSPNVAKIGPDLFDLHNK